MPPLIAADAALFLDLDGTLIDLAPTPDAVVVPDGLVASLNAVSARLGGALAIVTGRTIDTVDALLGCRFAAAGEHGAALRLSPGAPIAHLDLPRPPVAWIAQGEAAVAPYPGALLERKAAGFVLHYRRIPQAGPALEQAARGIVAADPRFSVMAAKMAWEIKPAGVNKGAAVRSLMAQPPFAGRRPVYVGDDVTDEAGIAACTALGGTGYRVGADFADPAAVRAWLRRV